jgi:hypothetical protein
MNIDIGTWYFDKWSRCYVQVVAGAQRDGYVTVVGYQPAITCAIKTTDLDLKRSRRIESMVGPVPVDLDDEAWEDEQEEKQRLHDEMINDKLIEDGRWG